LWGQRHPVARTIAENYLRETRGYRGLIQPTLGFLPARGDHPPALIAAFGIASEPESGELAIADADVIAVHLTKLRPDGSDEADIKPNKIAVGPHLGVPIIVAPPNDLLGIAICEGVESALSIHEATGLGGWASGGATFMPALAHVMPGYIGTINVFGDDDEAGRRHAPQLAARLRALGFKENQVIVKFLRAGSTT
jgi:hypothetical protein